MKPLVEPDRRPDRRPRGRAALPAARRPPGSPTVAREDARRPPAPPRGSDEEPPLRDAGITLLGTVSAAMLAIVGLAWLVGVVDRWWILIPAMAVALALTALVLAVVIRLLDED